MALLFRQVKDAPLTNDEVDDNFEFLETDKLSRVSGGEMLAPILLSGGAAPTINGHVTSKGYVDTKADSSAAAAITSRLPLTGGTLTGRLTLGTGSSLRLLSIGTPASLEDGVTWNEGGVIKFYSGAATKTVAFTDSKTAGWVTPRTLTLGTDLTGNASIDGTAPITLNATIATGAVTNTKIALATITADRLAPGVLTSGGIGYTGSQGIVGYTGSQGTLGIQGPIGYTGSAGSGASPSESAEFASLGVGVTPPGLPAGLGDAHIGSDLFVNGDITAFFSSDSRLKENVAPITDALNKVTKIRGVTFDWTEDHLRKQGGEDGYFIRRHDAGVIAQEIEMVLPEAVALRDNGIKAVRYEKIIPLLIEAIKDLKAELDGLKSTITER